MTKAKAPSQQWSAWLKHNLKKHGYSAIGFAAEVGVSRSAVYKWTSGSSIAPLDTWPRIAAAFDMRDWRDMLPPDGFGKK